MSEAIKEGGKAPAFKLASSSGTDVSLSALKGGKAVLFFYPKDDTSGCTREAVDFTSLLKDFEKAGTRVIGISPDPVKKHAKFIEKHDLGVELLADESKTMLEAYGVWAEKSMYGRKYMGVVRTTVLVDATGKIARIWPKVKVPGHAAEVLEAAKAL
ncbi:MAG: peroxiredoxin [Beijerinckiaceae bacterium]|jgi:thioredoxin-dependent peroxiredoxin|nr:peroxiredoxin [Beijerinckiaceae bacterium]